MIESVAIRRPAERDNLPDARSMSSYLEYLPSLYREDEFMGRFLLIFESIMGPIENTIDNIPFYFDPSSVPEALLPWLASWVDVVLDESWPVQRRRQLVGKAAELYRWRGTRKGLREYLKIYTGALPIISEQIPGMRLSPETKLGAGTRLGSSGAGHNFTVTLRLEDTAEVNLETIRAIIDAQKPAHTIYTLEIIKA